MTRKAPAHWLKPVHGTKTRAALYAASDAACRQNPQLRRLLAEEAGEEEQPYRTPYRRPNPFARKG